MPLMKDGLPGITRASFEQVGDELVVLNKTRSRGLLALGICAVLIALGIGSSGARGSQFAVFAVATPIVSTVIGYTCWLVARRTSIRLHTEGIVIENMFVRTTVPWRQGRQFFIQKGPKQRGLRLRLLDGRTYGVWAFQGSLAAQLTGYAAFEPILERLTNECSRIVADNPPEYPPPPTSWKIQIPDWWVILGIAAGTELVLMAVHLAA